MTTSQSAAHSGRHLGSTSSMTYRTGGIAPSRSISAVIDLAKHDILIFASAKMGAAPGRGQRVRAGQHRRAEPHADPPPNVRRRVARDKWTRHDGSTGAGRPVMRWVTKGTRSGPNGGTITWELRQTYDAVTLAPYGYSAMSSNGSSTKLTLDGTRVRGSRRLPGDTAVQEVDVTLDRPGFVASASDLVPTAVGLKAGTVITAPFWSPAMTKAELRIFSVLGQVSVRVEGSDVTSWKVEERRYSDRQLLATWYLVDSSPYMVYGEVPLPNGQTQRMTEVAIPMSERR